MLNHEAQAVCLMRHYPGMSQSPSLLGDNNALVPLSSFRVASTCRCFLVAMGGRPSKVPGGAFMAIRERNPDGFCFDVNQPMTFKDIYYKAPEQHFQGLCRFFPCHSNLGGHANIGYSSHSWDVHCCNVLYHQHVVLFYSKQLMANSTQTLKSKELSCGEFVHCRGLLQTINF